MTRDQIENQLVEILGVEENDGKSDTTNNNTQIASSQNSNDEIRKDDNNIMVDSIKEVETQVVEEKVEAVEKPVEEVIPVRAEPITPIKEEAPIEENKTGVIPTPIKNESITPIIEEKETSSTTLGNKVDENTSKIEEPSMKVAPIVEAPINNNNNKQQSTEKSVVPNNNKKENADVTTKKNDNEKKTSNEKEAHITLNERKKLLKIKESEERLLNSFDTLSNEQKFYDITTVMQETPAKIAKHFGMNPANRILLSVRGERKLKENLLEMVYEYIINHEEIVKRPRIREKITKDILI